MQQVQAVPQFEIEPLDGEIKRTVYDYEERKTGRTDKHGNPVTTHQLVSKEVKEPAGYMVYFARGHSIRARSKQHLRELGLDRPAGYTDPTGQYTDEDLAQMMPQPASLKERSKTITRQNSRGSASTKSSDQLANPEGE